MISSKLKLHPSKKVTQHNFDRLYFIYPGFLFIKLNISGKLYAFQLMPYLLGLFCWGTCRVSKFGGNIKKERLQNWSDWMGNACYTCIKFWAFLCECMHAYPRPIHCTESFKSLGGLRLFWDLGRGLKVKRYENPYHYIVNRFLIF